MPPHGILSSQMRASILPTASDNRVSPPPHPRLARRPPCSYYYNRRTRVPRWTLPKTATYVPDPDRPAGYRIFALATAADVVVNRRSNNNFTNDDDDKNNSNDNINSNNGGNGQNSGGNDYDDGNNKSRDRADGKVAVAVASRDEDTAASGPPAAAWRLQREAGPNAATAPADGLVTSGRVRRGDVSHVGMEAEICLGGSRESAAPAREPLAVELLKSSTASRER